MKKIKFIAIRMSYALTKWNPFKLLQNILTDLIHKKSPKTDLYLEGIVIPFRANWSNSSSSLIGPDC